MSSQIENYKQLLNESKAMLEEILGILSENAKSGRPVNPKEIQINPRIATLIKKINQTK